MAKVLGESKLTVKFIAEYVEEGAHRSSRNTHSAIQRKALLNLIATAANAAPIFAVSVQSPLREVNNKLNAAQSSQHSAAQSKYSDANILSVNWSIGYFNFKDIRNCL
jgi:hypothetical protein